jgi:hypothetical protein
MRQRAVRLDCVPAGGADNVASALNGFPLDGFIMGVSGTSSPPAPRGDSTPDFTVMDPLRPAKGFINNPGTPPPTAAAAASGDTTSSGFAGWSVRNGLVSAPDMKNSPSPFPFDVDGISMVRIPKP